MTLSTIAMFDDIRRCQNVLSDITTEEEFFRFAQFQEECRIKWFGAMQESQRLQRELDASLRSMADLESKLFHARRLLEMENKARREAENERDAMEKKMIAVRDLVRNERDLKDETKDKFAFLNYYPKKRKSFIGHMDEHYNDINSTGSFLSDLSLTQSEDDFLDVKTTRNFKKHRPSLPKASGTFVGGKKTRLSTEGGAKAGQKRKSSNNHNSSKILDIGPNDKIVAHTKVTVPQDGEGQIFAESIIEAIPQQQQQHNNPQQAKESSEAIIRNARTTAEQPFVSETPKKKRHAPATPIPPQQQFRIQAQTEGYSQQKKNFFRNHSFSTKTFLKKDMCSFCQKRISFGTVGLKCRDCRVVLHTDCKDHVTMACIPKSAGTPNNKDTMGKIENYAPVEGPMVPAIIVHCVNEIETRGLKEVGIYRVSGSEREVKALKERFLRGKGLPHLSNVDVYVLCGCIKDFLRSLIEPLIPTGLWKDFSNAIQNVSNDDNTRLLYNAIDRLPQANRDTLAFLIQHFQRVAQCEETKMNLSNLAKVFGPTIVGYSSADPDPHTIYTETMIQFTVMEALFAIPTDYWSRYVNVNLYNPVKEIISTTPILFSTRKQRKFLATPPYTTTPRKIFKD